MQTYTNKQVGGVCLPTNTAAVNRDNHTWGFTNQTNRWLYRVSGAIALSLGMSMLAVSQALAGSFSFTKIADTQSGDFTSISDGAVINDSGTVGFVAVPNVPDNPAFIKDRGLYTSNDGAIAEIFNPNQLPSLFNVPSSLPKGYFRYSLPNLAINNNGTIAFVAKRYDPQNNILFQILLAQGNSLTNRGSASFPGGISADPFIPLSLNDQDELTYLLTEGASRTGITGYKAILTRANQPDVTIAEAAPPLNGNTPLNVPLATISDVAINNNSEVTFAATRQSPNPSAIFTSLGEEPTSILETEASELSATDNGLVVFSNQNSIQLFNRTTGILRTIADTNGLFRIIRRPAINNNGEVAFEGVYNLADVGIFTGGDPLTDKVIATGDSLAGSTVTNLNFLRSGLNNNGQIVFSAELADGTQGIFRADPTDAETPPSQPVPQVEDAFALSRIVDTNTTIPGTTDKFSYLNGVTLDSKSVVFYGGQGIYKNSGGILSTIADRNTLIPNGNGTFNDFDIRSIIDNGNVAFTGRGNNGQQGIYIQRGDAPLSVVVDKNTPIPNSTGNFTSFSPLMVNENNVVFGGLVAGASQGSSYIPSQGGFYISRDGVLQVVQDRSNTPIPGGTGNFLSTSYPVMDGNNLAFTGTGANNQQGIYISLDGNLQVVADKNTPIPGGTGNFLSFSYLALDGNNVVFKGTGADNQEGIYISRNGNLQVVADGNTPIPGGSQNFSSFDQPKWNNGNVVFTARGNIYKSSNGILSTIADTNTTIPGSTRKFSQIQNVVVNKDIVVFSGSVNIPPFFQSATAGIYAYMGDSLVKVVDLSSRLDSSRITFLYLNSSDFDSSALKGNSLVFLVGFTDGTQAIFRADLKTDKLPKSVPE